MLSHRSVRRILGSAAIFALATFATAQATGPDPKWDAWLKANEFGPYQKDENWVDIAAKAEKEGEVVVYSSTPTVTALAEDFMKLHPKIKVKAFHLGSEKTIEKASREQQAGIFAADVVNTGGTEQMIFDMLPNRRLVNYVPRYLVDAVPVQHREPLLAHVMEAYVLFYNADLYKGQAPIKNIWELTEPQWKGRFAMKSPLGSLTTLSAFAAIVENDAPMAKAYEAHAGKKLVLSKNIESAGYEFLHRLIGNDIVFYDNGSKLATASGMRGQQKPPITLPSMHYLSQNEANNYANAIPVDLNPAAIFAYPTYVAVGAYAPHPNAAKLFVAFMMGSKELTATSEIKPPYRSGRSLELLQGMASFYQVGTFSPRTDMPMPPGGEMWPTARRLEATPEFQRDNIAKINDFWIIETSK